MNRRPSWMSEEAWAVLFALSEVSNEVLKDVYSIDVDDPEDAPLDIAVSDWMRTHGRPILAKPPARPAALTLPPGHFETVQVLADAAREAGVDARLVDLALAECVERVATDTAVPWGLLAEWLDWGCSNVGPTSEDERAASIFGGTRRALASRLDGCPADLHEALAAGRVWLRRRRESDPTGDQHWLNVRADGVEPACCFWTQGHAAEGWGTFRGPPTHTLHNHESIGWPDLDSAQRIALVDAWRTARARPWEQDTFEREAS